jgi:type II restriction enzyme
LGISKKGREEIYDILVSTMKSKREHYSRETTSAPFHERLLGKELYDGFSYVQSLNTSLGLSIWEQVAVVICRDAGGYAERQYRLQGSINEDVDDFIRSYMNALIQKKISSNKANEISEIRKRVGPGHIKYPNNVVDLFISFAGSEEYIDITSVKPNKKEFQTMKEKLLYWTAMRMSTDPEAEVMTRLAMPYNPYDPEPYSRWTDGQLYDISNGEILVGSEFWNHVGQGDVYNDLLDIFKMAGEEIKRNLR